MSASVGVAQCQANVVSMTPIRGASAKAARCRAMTSTTRTLELRCVGRGGALTNTTCLHSLCVGRGGALTNTTCLHLLCVGRGGALTNTTCLHLLCVGRGGALTNTTCFASCAQRISAEKRASAVCQCRKMNALCGLSRFPSVSFGLLRYPSVSFGLHRSPSVSFGLLRFSTSPT